MDKVELSDYVRSKEKKLSYPDTDHRDSPRRQARHEICLEANLSLFDAEAKPGQGTEELLTIFGNTYDVSETGVSFVVPLVPIDENYCRQEAPPLPLLLYLPTGPVNMRIAPVRCHPLDERKPEAGFFMGAEITAIEDSGRERFNKFLHTP